MAFIVPDRLIVELLYGSFVCVIICQILLPTISYAYILCLNQTLYLAFEVVAWTAYTLPVSTPTL